MTAETASSPVNYPLGNPAESHQTRVLLLGSGELGREIAIELTRLGAFVIAADSYEHAPAMQIAQESHVLDMTNAVALNNLIGEVQPSIIVPEVEAIATAELAKAASNGIQVVPSSRIAAICMDREALRTLMHEKLGLPTTPYRFAGSFDELKAGAQAVGYPCVVKPVMSSSGHGQSVLRSDDDLEAAWREAQTGRRDVKDGGISRVIVEAFAPLNYELTMLTVSSSAGIVVCSPIGQWQEDGDYRESWQPATVKPSVLQKAQAIARKAVFGLVDIAHENHEYGWGVFGVELFVLKNGDVLFNEVSPRPHDTGMVTMVSQHLSEFALHARAVLGIPVTEKDVALSLKNDEVAASHAVVVTGTGQVTFTNVSQALSQPDTDLRIFGKPTVNGHRRMGVALAIGSDEAEARNKAAQVSDNLDITIGK
ncbi:formate-dependent phosphoribosylglycinamide formyltransferase [Bifidobacterium sp. ESL0690]|uniref:formate-dependent phosphoribosylglycinamide formyltransferase n=1 Tax=Bifidobacterium sp. ESL0690 TaxID=2983214 RepID=UPI0023F837DF|nr:formate-dependent phosphoribosylglycinamide formyltransferase [Bifidobacterium sp. ESL0690]WEV46073.1 formate-dependent phosphoribosylglycinamide formyltransferase [Bifidobacterium sp. ESL0690]